MDPSRAPKRPLPEDGEGAAGPAAKRAAPSGVAAQIAKAKAIAVARARAAAVAAAVAAKAKAQAPASTTAAAADEPSAEERRRINAAKRVVIPEMDMTKTGMTRIQQLRQRESHHRSNKPRSKEQLAKLEQRLAREKAASANPYLAHWDASAPEADVSSELRDPRLAVSAAGAGRARERRAAKALHFVEEGSIAAVADEMSARREARAAEFARRRGTGSALRPAPLQEAPSSAAEAAGAAGGSDSASVAGPGSAAAAERAAAAEADGLSAAVAASLAALPKPPRRQLAMPSIEPWDVALLPPGQRQAHNSASKGAAGDGGSAEGPSSSSSAPALACPEPGGWSDNVRTLGLVEHPPAIAPAVAPAEPAPLPLVLTKQEKKKARRLRRQEREEERRLMQILGQIQPNGGKLKVSGLASTMQAEATANPTAIEAMAREQEAERRSNHDARNLARKLTPEEKREKLRRKFSEAPGEATSVALFRVLDMSHPSLRFRVGENAKQFYLTGRAVMCAHERVTLVAVEGGSKAVRSFKQLMLRRIAWRRMLLDAATECLIAQREAEAADAAEGVAAAAKQRAEALEPALQLRAAGLLALDGDGDDEGEGGFEDGPAGGEAVVSGAAAIGASAAGRKAGGGKFCELVWEGSLATRCFEEFRFETSRSLAAGRASLARAGHPEWWDMVVAAADRARVRPAAGGAAGSDSFSKAAAAAAAAAPDLPDLDELLG